MCVCVCMRMYIFSHFLQRSTMVYCNCLPKNVWKQSAHTVLLRCVCVFVHIYSDDVSVCACVYVHFVCVYVHLPVCACVFVHLPVCACVSVHFSVCVCICACVCVHMTCTNHFFIFYLFFFFFFFSSLPFLPLIFAFLSQISEEFIDFVTLSDNLVTTHISTQHSPQTLTPPIYIWME